MNYPNSKKAYVKPKKTASKRGMNLEDDINKSNSTYLNNNVAVIYKKPTPIQIVNVDYPKRSAAKISEAYFKVPSTTDYNGIYKKKYIDFEAKECESKTSFPFSLIHSHQIKHLGNVLNHGAIAFIILRMTYYEKDYLIKADDFIKSLSFSLTELEYFLLIVARTAGFVASAPFFSNTATPRTVKVGFTVLLSVLLYNVLPVSAVEYSTVFMYAVIVVKESLTGLLIGYGANICSSILNFAGHMVDMETGLSMVTLYDPMTRENTTITGSFYQYTITLMLFISGLYQYILMALKESFSLIPINGAIFKSDALLASMLEFLTDYISIGFTICLPIFCCILLIISQ